MITTIIQDDLATATANASEYNDIITTQGQEANLTAVVANMARYVAFIIPVARQAEYDAADEATRLKFAEVAQNTLQREGKDGDYLTIFEEEYIKIFG